MELKLVSYQAVIAVLTAVTIIVAVTSVVPAMMGDVMIDIPEEDDIAWSLSGNELAVKADIWINNSGNYKLKDINIDIALDGLNGTIFEDTKTVDSVDAGENRRIPIELTKSFDDFTEEQKETFVFNETTFHITSTMNAIYPFKILGFDLDYDHSIEWTGIVEQLEFRFDQAEVSSSNDDSSTLTLPYLIETYSGLSGTSTVNISMYDGHDDEVDNYETDIPLGDYHLDDFTFYLDEEETEDFITRSQTVNFIAEIFMNEGAEPFEYEASYEWGAPLNDLAFTDITYSYDTGGGTASSHLYFENDSPRYLSIDLTIRVFDSGDQLIGYDLFPYQVPPDENVDEQISLYIDGVPEYVEIQFYESNTGMEYDEFFYDIGGQ